jgi:hypothetical protein
MAVYLVTWDLNRQKANYADARKKLIDHLSRYPYIKDPGLDSVWFISTTASADAVSADVRTSMDDSDKLVVTQLISGHHQGWLAKSVWDWINARL